MIDLEERTGLVGRLDRWAGQLLERRYYTSLLVCILVQSAIALILGDRPFRIGPSVTKAQLFHDVELYHGYSESVCSGEVPYRDFTIEYPPLGLVVFLIPRLFASTFEGYKVGFCLEMLAFNAAAVVLAARWTASRPGIERVPRCLAWYSAFLILSLPVAMARYDLSVMFVTFATAYLLLSGRPVAGGALTAVSVLMKIFPGAVAAPAFFRELIRLPSSGLRGIVTAAVVFAAGLGAWVAVGRAGVLRTIQYHTERGLEIGSIYAGLVMLASRLGGEKVSSTFNHLANHLDTPTAMWLGSLAIWFQLGALLLAIGAYWRSGMRDGLRYSTACLLAVIVFGKVLSPQYLIWLIPFFACLEGPTGTRARFSFLIACGLTLLIFPYFFAWVTSGSPRGTLLLNARNLMLVMTYGILVFNRQSPAKPAEDSSHVGWVQTQQFPKAGSRPSLR